MTSQDYSMDAPEPTNEELARIQKLAVDLARLQKEEAELEARLERKRKQRADVQERQLPEAVLAIGMRKYTTVTGFEIEIKKEYFASPKKETYDAAMDWLEEHGAAAIVKRTITIVFNKDEDKWARKFMRDLARRKRPLRATNKRAVHPSTLRAYVREKYEEGADLPNALLGVHVKDVAKIRTK